MPMDHLGYIVYVAIVLLVYGSPVIAFLLYRGWKRQHLLATLVRILLTLPVLAAVLYGLFLAGLWLLATFSR